MVKYLFIFMILCVPARADRIQSGGSETISASATVENQANAIVKDDGTLIVTGERPAAIVQTDTEILIEY